MYDTVNPQREQRTLIDVQYAVALKQLEKNPHALIINRPSAAGSNSLISVERTANSVTSMRRSLIQTCSRLSAGAAVATGTNTLE